MFPSILRRAAPYLAWVYMTVVGRTSRLRWKGLDRIEKLKSAGTNFIYAFWHNRQVLFTYTHRGAGVSALVSKSRDGEVIARTMELSRISAIRGSSSRGAASAVLEMMDAAALKGPLAITPDGPKGPAGVVKPGVIYLAMKTRLPIVPISNASSRKLVFKKSWDRYQVPLPFGACWIVHGKPMTVSPGDDLERKAGELARELDRVTAEAEELVRE